VSDLNGPEKRPIAVQSPNEMPETRVVLYVDAQEAQRQARARILRSAGFLAIEAVKGADAWRLAVEARPALVVLQSPLSDEGDFDVCERLRTDPRTQAIPVLRVSAVGGNEQEFDAHLREPIEAETLIATVSALLQTREHRERLRRSEAKYRSLLDQAFEGIWAVDSAGRTVFVNRRMAEMLQCADPAELTGRSAFDFVPEEDREILKGRFAARIAGDSRERYEVRLRRADGSLLWTAVSGSTLLDGQGRPTGRLALFTDISEQKAAEAALRASQQRLVLAIEAAELGTWELDLSTGAVTASERVGAIFDVPVPEPRLETWMSRLYAEDAERVRRALQGAIEGTSRFESEFRVVRRDGNIAWVAAKGVPVVDAGGRVRQLLGVTQDITARKETEQARERERELLQGIIDNIPVMLCVYDPGLRRFELNREAQRVLGWTNEDASQSDFMAKVYPDPAYRAEVAEYMQRLTPGWLEVEATAKDGSTVASEWANIQLSDDRIIGIGIDVRARNEAQRALRESEERFRTMADSIAPLAWMADANGSIFWFSRRFHEYTGTTLEQVQGWGWQSTHHPDHVERVVQRLRVSFETGEPWEDMFPLRRHDGEYRWFLSGARPIRNAGGQVVRWFGTSSDITERLEAEERLRVSEQRYRSLFESLQEGFHLSEIICDESGKAVDWRFLAVNSAFESMIGVSREAVVGRTYREVFPDSDCDYWVECLGEVGLTGTAKQVKKSEAGRDWEMVAYSPSAGQFAVIFSDVTERRQAEAAAEQRKQDYETLAENAPEVIARFDREMRHIYINNYGATVYGKPKEEILGKTNAELGFPDWHVTDSTQHFKEVLATGRQRTVDFEFDSPHFGSQFFSCLFVPETDTAGRVASVLAITRDVTEQKQAEAAREELVRHLSEAVQKAHRNRSELEAVLQAMQDGVAVFDMQGRIVFHNNAHKRIGGYNTPDDLPPDLEAVVRVIELRRSDGSVVPFEERPASRVLRGESITDLELCGRRPTTGQEWHFRFSGEPVYEPGGRQILAVIITRDITVRKRAEERIRQSQKLESLGLLAGGIAHDFNNLLTGIMGNASMVIDEIEPSHAERVREVIASAERAANLTRQLLAYSGKGQFIVRELNVSEAVHEIAPLVEFSIPKSVQLAVTVERRLPLVRMDPSQLQQVLMNLVINAGEAIGEGQPGRISVATSTKVVERAFVDAAGEEVAPGRYVCIEVTDTGNGIDEDKRAKIFDPFFTTKFTGRGLGLAAVAGIVRSQKGGITVESAAGRGSTFRVFLAASDGRAAAPPKGDGIGGGATVLVVDDEAAVRNFIGAVLRKHGYRVVSASDGEEALTVMERERNVAAVVLDVIMPVMGGNDVLPMLKAMRPELKVLLTSGYSESEARRLCATYPGAAFMQKPYTAQQVAKAVEELMRGE
jgi:PAS domain S-box-containing protein